MIYILVNDLCKKHIFICQKSIYWYMYIMYNYMYQLYLAYENTHTKRLDFNELYNTLLLIMFTHALTLFVLIITFCIVYWFILKYYKLYLIIVNCSLLHLVIHKGFPCSQLIFTRCVELWLIYCYPCHCEVWDPLSAGVLLFILRWVCVCVCRIRAIFIHKKTL